MKLKMLLLLLWFPLIVCSQTVLSRHHLELTKPEKHHQIIHAVNDLTKELFVIAADKEKLNVHKYNSAIFLSDSLIVELPEIKDFPILIGTSFDDQGIPSAYFASEDYKKVLALQCNLKEKTAIRKTSTFTFQDESLLYTFQSDNKFYFLASGTAKENENKLKLYVFTNGVATPFVIDFSPYKIVNQRNNIISVKELFEANPLELIDQRNFVPLVSGAAKSKLFIDRSNLYLTFDHNLASTQVFEINLLSFSVSEHFIAQEQLSSGPGESNSFYHSGVLYQLKLNEQQLALSATDLMTEDLIQTYTTSVSEEIKFKNSPLLMQIGSRPPREFKNARKFLEKAGNSNAAITVYKTPDHFLITSGAIRSIASTEDVMLGIIAIGAGMSDGDVEISGFDRSNIQSFFFESLFDEKFNHATVAQTPLAADALSNFLAESKDVSLETVTPYDGYFILGYYDKEAKTYVLRKFEDYRRY
ncbi:MAG TPA: hypothetical protein VGB44_00020 [Flavobacterium sp.]